MKNRSKSRRAVKHNGNSTAVEDRVISSAVEDSVISTIIGPVLDLRSLFMLIFSSRKLYKNYKPFILGILPKEDVVLRLLRVCARELHRRREVDLSAKYSFYLNMDGEIIEKSERFLTFNFATFISFTIEVPKRPRFYQSFVVGQDLTDVLSRVSSRRNPGQWRPVQRRPDSGSIVQ